MVAPGGAWAGHPERDGLQLRGAPPSTSLGLRLLSVSTWLLLKARVVGLPLSSAAGGSGRWLSPGLAVILTWWRGEVSTSSTCTAVRTGPCRPPASRPRGLPPHAHTHALAPQVSDFPINKQSVISAAAQNVLFRLTSARGMTPDSPAMTRGSGNRQKARTRNPRQEAPPPPSAPPSFQSLPYQSPHPPRGSPPAYAKSPTQETATDPI